MRINQQIVKTICSPAAPRLFRSDLNISSDDVTDRLSERIAHESGLASGYLDLIFITRAFERIGDNSANIAEDSFWRDQAEDIRHTYGPKKEQ
jgi:phosphate uptake regulator